MGLEHRSPAAALSSRFRHSALTVESDHSVRALLVPAVRRAQAESDAVFIAVSAATAGLLRDELGPAADSLEWGDPAAFYQRLGFTYEGFRRFLAAQHAAGRRVHVFAEPDLGEESARPGPVDRIAAYLAYESMCNEAYAAYECPVTCLWDARRYSTLVIENVRTLHNHQLGRDGDHPTDGYLGPRDYLAGRDQVPLPRPAAVDWETTLDSTDDLPALRERLRRWAVGAGFAETAAADVALAVNEIATNGLTHGKPPATVRAWQHDDTLIVQVDDPGGTPLPPLGGYLPPDLPQDHGRGLWLARQLADVVQTHTVLPTRTVPPTPGADGLTAVRLYFPGPLTHRRPAYLGG